MADETDLRKIYLRMHSYVSFLGLALIFVFESYLLKRANMVEIGSSIVHLDLLVLKYGLKQ